MSQEYLPGGIRDRIQDLMKERKLSQNELAKQAGCTESTLSRFLTGKTDKLSDENIVAIAGVFGVSTDFLLGLTNIPDRTNYDLAELGLSVQAGKALRTSKATATVINAMLESKSFPVLAQLIFRYMEGTNAEGFAAQNQLYTSLAALTAGENSEVADLLRSMKTPVYQPDVTHIQNVFNKVLAELKQDHTEKLAETRKLTSEVVQSVFSKLPKDDGLRSITAEQMADAVTGTIGDTGSFTPEQLAKFRAGFFNLLQKPAKDIGIDE